MIAEAQAPGPPTSSAGEPATQDAPSLTDPMATDSLVAARCGVGAASEGPGERRNTVLAGAA